MEQLIKYYTPLCFTFFKFMELFSLLVLHKSFSHFYGLNCHFHCFLNINYLLLKVARVLMSINWKIWCAYSLFIISYSWLGSIPLLAGPFIPKMAKKTLVQNYVMNHNQSIFYGTESAHLFLTMYLVMYINLGFQEWFFIIFDLIHMHKNQNQA